MSQAQYSIYRQQILDLANTLVVKSKATANALNLAMQRAGFPVNDNDPATWKYYQNLAGQYHASDKPMTVKSLDTLQNIEFTRTNLQLHSATAREYRYGQPYYFDLVRRYPDQEMLILGILNPVDVDTAIDAVDGEILYYDRELVEENETNLIPRLALWSKSFMARWDLQAYSAVDMAYPAAQLWVLFSNLPNEIENIRFLNTHTIYAHSFHIREFLAGQGRLDRYFDALTTEQRLWLYRNIRYLHRNVGKQTTFETLIERLLTRRGLPLAEWGMEHNTTDQLEEFYPKVEFVRHNLNTRTISQGRDVLTIEQMLEKEAPVAKGNAMDLPEAEAATKLAMENSLQNKLQTKVLESSVLDLTDAYPYTQSDMLLNHWAYLAFQGRYTAYVTVDDPRTGSRLTLSVKDAFLAYLYSYNRARGITLETMGELTCQMIRRTPTPTFETLRALAPRRSVPDKLIRDLFKNWYVMPSNYISTENFNIGVTSIFRNLMDQRFLWSSQHDYVSRGQLKGVALHLYMHHRLSLGGATTYKSWMDAQGLALDDYENNELDLLATELLKAATGRDLKTELTLKEMQSSMLRLTAQLSSYSIQFVQTINSSPIKVVDWGTVSPTEPEVKGYADSDWNVAVVRGLGMNGQGYNHDWVDVSDLGASFKFHTKAYGDDYLDINLAWTNKSRPRMRQAMLLPRLELLSLKVVKHNLEQVDDLETEHYVPLNRTPLDDAFLGLQSDHYRITDDDRQTLEDRWNEWLINNPIDIPDPDYDITVADLDGYAAPELVIGIPVLDGFHYPDAEDFGNVVLDQPLIPPVLTPDEFDLELSEFPDFDGLTSPLGEFAIHELMLVNGLSVAMPDVLLYEDITGHTPFTITLNPVMLGYMVMRAMNPMLEGHIYKLDTIELKEVLDGHHDPESILNPVLDGFHETP